MKNLELQLSNSNLWSSQVTTKVRIELQTDPTLGKVTVSIKAVGSTAQINLKTITANRSYTLNQISTLIRSKLGCKPTDSLFIYVRSSFAPPPDARIADLFDVWPSFTDFVRTLRPTQSSRLITHCKKPGDDPYLNQLIFHFQDRHK